MVYRVYVERRPEYALEAARIKQDLRRNLQISSLREVRLYNRYDIEGIDEATLKAAEKTVFSEPQTEIVSDKIILSEDEVCFAVEYLPGQYDQRADSAAQCIQLITRGRSEGSHGEMSMFFRALMKTSSKELRNISSTR